MYLQPDQIEPDAAREEDAVDTQTLSADGPNDLNQDEEQIGRMIDEGCPNCRDR
jgi:hypothetical protein